MKASSIRAASIVLLAVPVAFAQHPNPATYPGAITRQDIPTLTRSASATPEERRAALAFADAAVQVLKHDAAAASPRGYLVWITPEVADDDRDAANPTGRYRFGLEVGPDFWWWSDNQNKMMNSSDMGHTGGTVEFNIVANSLECLFPTLGAGADTVGAFYEVPRVIHDASGATVYTSQRPRDGGQDIWDTPSCVVLTNVKRPLWVPVSRERYLRTLIADARKGVAMVQNNVRANSPKAQLAQEQKDRDEMQKAMMAMCDQMKASSPKQYNDCVATVRQSQKAMDSTYRAMASDPNMDAAMKAADTAGNGRVRELEAQLAAMSPADRARPAVRWRADTANALPWSFLPRRNLAAPESLATPIVEPNHAFLDPALPRSVPQIITVEMGVAPSVDPRIAKVHDFASCVAAYDEDTCTANQDNPEFHHCAAEYREMACLPMRRARVARELLDGFDWPGLRALLRP